MAVRDRLDPVVVAGLVLGLVVGVVAVLAVVPAGEPTVVAKADIVPAVVEDWARDTGQVAYPADLRINTTRTCVPSIEALARGDADIAFVPLMYIDRVLAERPDAEIVAGIHWPANYTNMYVPRDSDIRSVSDLRNRTIAVSPGVIGMVSTVAALENEGLPRSAYDTVYDFPIFRIPGYLERGEADAAVMFPPPNRSAYRSILSPVAYWEDRIGQRIHSSWIMAAPGHVDEAEAYARALNESYRAVAGNEDDFRAYAAEHIGQEHVSMAMPFTRSRVYEADPGMLDRYQEWIDDLYRDGHLTRWVNITRDRY